MDTASKTAILIDISSSMKDTKHRDLKESSPEDENVDVQDLSNEPVKAPSLVGKNVMNIILIATKCTSWIKTGGLGDVAGALQKALARRGHRVMVNFDLLILTVRSLYLATVIILKLGTQELEILNRWSEFEGVGFSMKTAHRITGADILLLPSRFEPCGLNQLYAMRYGTIPVVHAVGGLRDTVKQFNPYEESGLGWTFYKADANELITALGNCLLAYRQYKTS